MCLTNNYEIKFIEFQYFNVLKYIRHKLKPFRRKIKKKRYYKKLKKDFGIRKYECDNFLKKLNKRLIKKISKIKEEKIRDQKITPGIIGEERAKILYSIVKSKKPDTVVETGVCNGYSTAVILKAMEENNKGHFYSIDMPEKVDKDQDYNFSKKRGGGVVPSEKKCGWLVPEAFEDRWTLMLGNSRYKLPELLKEKDSIDIFIHDSEHTYRTMMFEYCIAWDKLKDGGLLLSDDISYNAAFTDFIEATEYSKKAVSYLGIVGK